MRDELGMTGRILTSLTPTALRAKGTRLEAFAVSFETVRALAPAAGQHGGTAWKGDASTLHVGAADMDLRPECTWITVQHGLHCLTPLMFPFFVVRTVQAPAGTISCGIAVHALGEALAVQLEATAFLAIARTFGLYRAARS